MPEDLVVSSVAEERRHVESLACPECRQGYRIQAQWSLKGGVDLLEIQCAGCGRVDEVRFRISSR